MTFAVLVALLGSPEFAVREAADAALVAFAPSRKAVHAAASASDDQETRDRLRRHASRLTIREVDALAGAEYPQAFQINGWVLDPAKYDLTWVTFPADWEPEFWHDPPRVATFDFGWIGWWHVSLNDHRGRTRAALIMYYGRTGDRTKVLTVLETPR